MSWSSEEIRNNASILYNHLCGDSNKASRVYIDKNGHFQIDKRNSCLFWFRIFRWLFPLGDISRETTDRVAVQTLRQVSDALEDGRLDPKQVIMQESKPRGLFMKMEGGTEEDNILEVAESYNAIKRHVNNSTSPLHSTNPSSLKKTWISRETFGMNIGNASRFKAWMPVGNRDENKLSYNQKICSRVTVLSQMILHGRELYIKTCGDFGYIRWS